MEEGKHKMSKDYKSCKNRGGGWYIEMSRMMSAEKTHYTAEDVVDNVSLWWDDGYIEDRVDGIKREHLADIIKLMTYAYATGAIEAMNGVEPIIDCDGSLTIRTLLDDIEIKQKSPMILARGSEDEDFDYVKDPHKVYVRDL